MIIIDKNAKREVQVKYPDRTRVLFPNLDDGYISSNDIVVPSINAPISDDGVSVATINDGAEGGAISKLVIGIEPVQDLHGQSNPYPPGGGKNMLKPYKRTVEASGVTYSVADDGKITLSGTATGDNSFSIWTSASGITVPETSDYTVSLNGAVNAKINGSATATLNVTANNVPSGFAITITNGITYNESFYVQIEKGTTATAYAPYSNICPITGWTEAKVLRCGKNLVPLDGWEQGQLSGGNGIPNGVSYSVSSPFILLKGGKTYMLSRNYPEYGSGQMAYHTYTLDKIHVSDSGWVTNNQTISPSNDCYIRLTTRAKPNTDNPPALSPSDVGTVFTVQLEIGSTATTYEPYSGNTYTIDLNGTRYGGTLDVTTGVLTVDKQYIDCKTITTWTVDKSAERFYKVVSELLPATSGGEVADGLICNRFKSISADQIYAKTEGIAISTGSALQFHITGLTDNPNVTLAQINEYFTNNETIVVAKLATPITAQLTPQEVTTLLGQNNIWADCGDVLELSYSANMNIRLQDLLGEKLDKPTTPGTLGQVLTSDGEGGQTWETPE